MAEQRLSKRQLLEAASEVINGGMSGLRFVQASASGPSISLIEGPDHVWNCGGTCANVQLVIARKTIRNANQNPLAQVEVIGKVARLATIEVTTENRPVAHILSSQDFPGSMSGPG